MLIITTTRLLRLQERPLPHLLLPLLLILPQHKPIRSKFVSAYGVLKQFETVVTQYISRHAEEQEVGTNTQSQRILEPKILCGLSKMCTCHCWLCEACLMKYLKVVYWARQERSAAARNAILVNANSCSNTQTHESCAHASCGDWCRSRCWANCCLLLRLAWARKRQAWRPYTIPRHILPSEKNACGRCAW